MGSNVVQLPNGKWVAKGSSDDTGGGSNSNYGKSVYEVKYDKMREVRKQRGIKDIESKPNETAEQFKKRLNQERGVVTEVKYGNKTAQLRSSQKFQDKLKQAINAENARRQKIEDMQRYNNAVQLKW